MKEILQLFRRDAEHVPSHESATNYDLGSKPRILKDFTSSSAGSSNEGSAGTERRMTPPVNQPNGSGKREDAVYGRRW